MNHTSALGSLTFHGPEALNFLQAQLASDISLLSEGDDLVLTALLNAKGRVLATGWMACEKSDTFRWFLPADQVAWLQQHLQRYVFRTKVTIKGAYHQLEWGSEKGYQHPGGLKFVITQDLQSETPYEIADPVWLTEWEHGTPVVLAAAREQHLAHSLKLLDFNAASVKKGCYPGQEIVARTHFLGKSKRSLAALISDRQAQAGDAVASGDGKVVGEVLYGARDGEQYRYWAVIRGSKDAELTLAD